MTALPTLFVPHGAPSFALETGGAATALAELATRLPRPRAILAVSAHWETPVPTVGAAIRPKTTHDFWGFPAPLYQLRYPAPGSPALAIDVRDLLDDAGFQARLDPARGLDHGAWVPLLHMYPQADIPVVPLSLQSRLGPDHHLALGRALAPLAAEGVLILASGNLTHNLGDVDFAPAPGTVPEYVLAFRQWTGERLAAADTGALLDYRRQAPGAARAHPGEEHLLPLFVALGAAGETFAAERFHAGVSHGAIAMDGFAFRPLAATPEPLH